MLSTSTSTFTQSAPILLLAGHARQTTRHPINTHEHGSSKLVYTAYRGCHPGANLLAILIPDVLQ
ncbi:hypothetical protein FVEN_g13090 [Fusarium venenatum]|nr:hypothetical protein FVEN_g13090 [Fusarium venenatum]